jgi:hypothetical protein
MATALPSRDTPPNPKGIYSTGYDVGSLDHVRTFLLHDLGPKMPVYMVESLVPDVYDDLMVKVATELGDSAVYDAVAQRWACCSQDPAQMESIECEGFKFLEGLVREIGVRCAARSFHSQSQFMYSPNKTPNSEAGNTSRPDFPIFCGQLTGDRPDRKDISVPVEVKKQDTHDNIENVCNSPISLAEAASHPPRTSARLFGVNIISCAATLAVDLRTV